MPDFGFFGKYFDVMKYCMSGIKFALFSFFFCQTAKLATIEVNQELDFFLANF